MYLDLLEESSPDLYRILLNLDRETARQARKEGCLACNGKLHQANYPRKPRGGPMAEDPEFCVRLSFCCATQGCRRRRTPASVLFLGRKVYFAAMVVLVVSCLHHGPTLAQLKRLTELTKVEVPTLRRWLRWWRTEFVESPLWAANRGLLARPVDVSELPHSLLTIFLGEARDQLVSLLGFLGPLTSCSASENLVF